MKAFGCAVLGLAWAVSCLPCAARADAIPPSAEQFYESAVRAMRTLQQPQNATYVADVHTQGASFQVTRQPNGRATIGFVIGVGGTKPDGSYSIVYRGSDLLTALQTEKGDYAVTSIPLFNPTWSGIYSWMRYGLDGAPPATPSKPPASSADPSAPPVIAVVASMGGGNYRVEDRGGSQCANGDAAHSVHLIARSNPDQHPLTDAAVDLRTQRFCMVRFRVRQDGALGLTGFIEMQLGDVNGYRLVQNETIDLTVRAMGIAVRHIIATATYRNFAFPATIGPGIFNGG